MGNYTSSNAPMIKLNGKMVRSRAFREIQTYKDAFKIADIHIADDAQLVAVEKEKYTIVFAYERFQIVEGLRYKDKTLYIERLYGRH
jgi:hypothetical protein